MYFTHETLDAYRVAVEVARWIARSGLTGSLRDQAVRSSQSVALNIAEGHAMTGKRRLNHYNIAIGSAAEVCACLDLTDLGGAEEQQEKLRRILLMLTQLKKK